MKFITPLLLLLFYSIPCFGNAYIPQTMPISPQIALPIGIKIWFNECGGSIMGLTTWNYGEDFASLGIGHFLWHPSWNNQASFNSGFPHLLRYIEKRGIRLPWWLQGKNGLYCPWNNREEFLQAQDSTRMKELRDFLQQTIPVQAEYMASHLQKILPDLLVNTPPEERTLIYNNFLSLAHTPAGTYALIDYLNFKGGGISNSPNNYTTGTGLLQVLRHMSFAPRGSTPLQAYVWSAKKALIKRVERSSSPHNERWLAGWFKRLNTYLEGERNHTFVN